MDNATFTERKTKANGLLAMGLGPAAPAYKIANFETRSRTRFGLKLEPTAIGWESKTGHAGI